MALTSINTIIGFTAALILLSMVQGSSVSSSSPSVPLKWFIFREDCFDKFFVEHDLLNKDCLKVTISKCIGYTIILGSFILKVPQILKILKSKSVEGISKWLYYIDVSLSNHIYLISINLQQRYLFNYAFYSY